MYISCVEEDIPWTFAYDRQNYARCLVPFHARIVSTMSVVYRTFKGGQFYVQMSKDNPFGGNEADKTIENTINRDCKTRGGYVGFSANFTSEIIG